MIWFDVELIDNYETATAVVLHGSARPDIIGPLDHSNGPLKASVLMRCPEVAD